MMKDDNFDEDRHNRLLPALNIIPLKLVAVIPHDTSAPLLGVAIKNRHDNGRDVRGQVIDIYS